MYASWETLVKQRVRDATRRSRSRGCLEKEDLFNYSFSKLKDQKYKCALCKIQLTRIKGDETVASLDRINSPHTVKKGCEYHNNCRWVCWKCNHSTRDCHMPFAKFKISKCD